MVIKDKYGTVISSIVRGFATSRNVLLMAASPAYTQQAGKIANLVLIQVKKARA